MSSFQFPSFYPIADDALLRLHQVMAGRFAEELKAAGVTLLQYRNKAGGPQAILRDSAVIWEALAGSGCRLMLNDRADLVALAGFDGVHVGHEDLSPEDARKIVGPDRWVGVSTHTEEQVMMADSSCADYVAVGPVFATGTKLDAEAVIGLDGIRRARKLTRRPIVAIGGITRWNAKSVIDSGADSVAVISALFVEGETIEKVARDFVEILR
ncbi:MAG: thiamine phosphate synthase [Edaphobacter sp.]